MRRQFVLLASYLGLSPALALAKQDVLSSVENPSERVPEYFTLPPLREQLTIQDGWTKERRDGIPRILEKYGVDAWLVRNKPFPFL